MSIILDALKKSETERQQQGQAEFSQVPIRHEHRRTPLWIWVVGILLVVNLVALVGMFMRTTPGENTAPVVAGEHTATVPSTQNEPAVVTPSFAEQLADIEPVEPAANTAPAERTADATGTTEPANTVSPQVTTASATTGGSLPDVDQLRASGELMLGEQRLDIHVYSDTPASRFVFINMTKLREGATTSDGVTVEEITENGVVLSYQGRQFFQARQ